MGRGGGEARGGASGGAVALGVAPHSGWAAWIALRVEGRPEVLLRERIELADPRDPASKQPYHAVEGLGVDEAARRLQAYETTAADKAHEALSRAVDALRGGGRRVVGVGILDSSGRKGSSLASTLASHALIHTADGDHFRSAIAAAAGRCGLPAPRVRARDLEAEAATATGRRPEALKKALVELGREVGPPWTADQKAAALLAWLLLARSRSDDSR